MLLDTFSSITICKYFVSLSIIFIGLPPIIIVIKLISTFGYNFE